MTQPVKFYQVGSYAAGNRLLGPEHQSVQADPARTNSLTSGHRACQGCGEALGARYVLDTAMRITNGRMIVANATGCLEVFSTPYPESSWRVPWLHSVFGNAPAVATGMAAAMRVKGHHDVRVIAQGGDGGTVDIGLGCLSGMFERNDDVLFVCYDNEAYMNTGVQRSASTPPGARTMTTPAVGDQPGNPFGQGKEIARIARAHRIPYVATATVADLRDLEGKAAKAMSMHGARFLHVLVPCPLGWRVPSGDTIKVARLARESGLFPVYEAEYGNVVAVTPIRHRVPVETYLRAQGRYAHLFGPTARPDLVARITAIANRNIAEYGLLDPDGTEPKSGYTDARPGRRAAGATVTGPADGAVASADPAMTTGAGHVAMPGVPPVAPGVPSVAPGVPAVAPDAAAPDVADAAALAPQSPAPVGAPAPQPPAYAPASTTSTTSTAPHPPTAEQLNGSIGDSGQ